MTDALTVKDVSLITGLTVRTLQYYDKIDLLKPSDYSKAGYRLYSKYDLKKLQIIMLFKELEFPLKEIKRMLSSSTFDKQMAIKDQIELLVLKRDRINKLITFAKNIDNLGVEHMDFDAFNTDKIEQYKKQAKEKWGDTAQYKESVERSKHRTKTEEYVLTQQLMNIFTEFAEIKSNGPSSSEAQTLVKKLQDFISENYYQCSNEILMGLGQMYAAGGEFTENIDNSAGVGTASFVNQAISVYVTKQK